MISSPVVGSSEAFFMQLGDLPQSFSLIGAQHCPAAYLLPLKSPLRRAHTAVHLGRERGEEGRRGAEGLD